MQRPNADKMSKPETRPCQKAMIMLISCFDGSAHGKPDMSASKDDVLYALLKLSKCAALTTTNRHCVVQASMIRVLFSPTLPKIVSRQKGPAPGNFSVSVVVIDPIFNAWFSPAERC